MEITKSLKNLSQIVNTGLCHRCGTCVGMCPHDVLATDEDGYPEVRNLSWCTSCGLCGRVCPGSDFDFEKHHQRLYGTPGNLKETHGHFLRATVAYSTDNFIRDNSTSGGIVTALVIHMIESGKADGAVVIASDERDLWKGKAILATNRDEVLSAMKSKYSVCPTNIVFSEIKKRPGKFVLVGLPCQIQGYLKAAAADPIIREKIILSIGLFCHASVELDAYKVIWETLGDKVTQAKKYISRLGKHPGTPHIEMKGGILSPVYFPEREGYRPSSTEVLNVLYRLYTPERCFTCFDALAQFADISVGDPFLPPPSKDTRWSEGWSFVMLRTNRGEDAYNDCLLKGRIHSVELSKIAALSCNRKMAKHKRSRAFELLKLKRLSQKAFPIYAKSHPENNLFESICSRLELSTHTKSFSHSKRDELLKYLLTKGYRLFWLNSFQRKLQTSLRGIYAIFSKN